MPAKFTLSEVHSLMGAQNNECDPLIGKLSLTGVRRTVCAYVVPEHQPPLTHPKQSFFMSLVTGCEFGREQRDVVRGRVTARSL